MRTPPVHTIYGNGPVKWGRLNIFKNNFWNNEDISNNKKIININNLEVNKKTKKTAENRAGSLYF